ncbi:MAG: queuosine precursor transporter [Candidatus Magasanikbacteria bacterium]|jgi:queuosine precursor transporter|nr:queuosine precursor transporter [Candidatus Magasanikbacteria bacterium]MBT4314615.1 queuosine precursor transporter [Candidatus Magasanikbacteria bacterium]MBT4547036.1 queuosine precursor transporter [Candidatus Magasanikbacteria bacterium]MBT6819496.1 queuosine precursor transporter [Candidatus Magasanikbacteria bacterium]
MSQHFKLTIISSIFIAGLLAANLLGSKITTLFGVAVSVGIFAYPLTFMMTDAVAEVYGKKKAKQLVWAALIAQVLVLILTLVAVKLPAASRYTFNEQYVTVFSGSIRMMIASLIAFIISQTHDIWAFEFWKEKFGGRWLWLRNNASTMVSQAIDTLLFMFIAFYGISDKFTVGFILHLCLSYWLFKMAFAVLDTPLVYLLVNWLRKPGKEDEVADNQPLQI